MKYKDFPTREKERTEFWGVLLGIGVIVLVLACIECFRLTRGERDKAEGYSQMAVVMPCR